MEEGRGGTGGAERGWGGVAGSERGGVDGGNGEAETDAAIELGSGDGGRGGRSLAGGAGGAWVGGAGGGASGGGGEMTGTGGGVFLTTRGGGTASSTVSCLFRVNDGTEVSPSWARSSSASGAGSGS